MEFRVGDKVFMNSKYFVSKKNNGKEFIIASDIFNVCGTDVVFLQGENSCYAVDGLTKIKKEEI